MRTDGTKSYFTATHTEKTVASMHDHSEFVRTSGLGEMVAVLNGVEFRTRHNDYKLVMPSKSSQVYHATEDIPFPDVPLEVGNQSSFDMQVCLCWGGGRWRRGSVCLFVFVTYRSALPFVSLYLLLYPLPQCHSPCFLYPPVYLPSFESTSSRPVSHTTYRSTYPLSVYLPTT